MENNQNSNAQVTSLVDLQKYAKGQVVKLPSFAEGQPFIAMLRRPSMLVLAKQGKIPNSLLAAAGELFSNGGARAKTADANMLSDMYDICHIICESALVEPSLADIQEAGLDLTDQQMMAIFNYTQVGLKALEGFREDSEDLEHPGAE